MHTTPLPADRTREAGHRPSVRITTVDGAANPDWAHSERGMSITVPRRQIITRDSSVFAMGSCFAVEIRSVLRRRGFHVLPDYFGIDVDLDHVRVGRLPSRDNINHYDTFSIRHEFEQAFGERPPAGVEDFWRIDSEAVRSGVGLGSGELYQNPYRKRVFADSAEALHDVSSRIDDCIGRAVRVADVFIITMGMIETWRNVDNGRYLCRRPDGDQFDRCEFVLGDVDANLDNMRRVCGLIEQHRPGTPVVLTVSPVAIARTYTDADIVVANAETKSLLRTVAGQMAREFDSVTYWPSYEIAMREDIFAADGRHITDDGVRRIVDAFLAAHCDDPTTVEPVLR